MVFNRYSRIVLLSLLITQVVVQVQAVARGFSMNEIKENNDALLQHTVHIESLDEVLKYSSTLIF